MRTTYTESLIASDVQADAKDLATRFARRDPFRHVVIDHFFAPDFAARLMDEFPPFERGNARNEAGELGRKSTFDRIRKLGPGFTQLDNLIRSRNFLDLIGRITGIEELLYDPWYFGGGTHENRDGQDLDPHVDFNRHPIEPWHRRLNLIVYLNRAWDDAWGGSLELHSDPRAANDRIERITPLHNRCVIFETTESSWHGFPPIALPPEHRDVTRKSIALYFYTRERPADELADAHSTIYVDQPLPEHIRPGLTLSEHDVTEIQSLLARRDQHNQRLYRDITALSTQLEQARLTLNASVLGRIALYARRALQRLRR
ncbi:MAG: 2OG-Fe(II) oxygenase [Rhodanobacteraceae bacterium]